MLLPKVSPNALGTEEGCKRELISTSFNLFLLQQK